MDSYFAVSWSEAFEFTALENLSVLSVLKTYPSRVKE